MVYDTPNGGYVQRLSVDVVKSVSPSFRNLQDGDNPDQFELRKPDVHERMFAQNFDFQSWISIQDTFQIKTIFISQYGMGELISAILARLQEAYTVQEVVNFKECLNAAINSVQTPLKASQVENIGTFDDDEPTSAQLSTLILRLKNVATSLQTSVQTGAYNALGYESVVDPSEMVLLMRSGIKNAMAVQLMVGAFNPDQLSIPFDIIETDDFGGITYQINSTPLYPVYDKNGTERGLAEYSQKDLIAYKAKTGTNAGLWCVDDSGTEVVLLQKEDTGVEAVDPNANVLAGLMQKGAIFENAQNPYEVEVVRNARGKYNNYWASRPGTAICYDALYNLIVFTKTPSNE